jgi:hypothetical protein
VSQGYPQKGVKIGGLGPYPQGWFRGESGHHVLAPETGHVCADLNRPENGGPKRGPPKIPLFRGFLGSLQGRPKGAARPWGRGPIWLFGPSGVQKGLKMTLFLTPILGLFSGGRFWPQARIRAPRPGPRNWPAVCRSGMDLDPQNDPQLVIFSESFF